MHFNNHRPKWCVHVISLGKQMSLKNNHLVMTAPVVGGQAGLHRRRWSRQEER
jgi:hypothetical protein